jgi:hypothetical protein
MTAAVVVAPVAARAARAEARAAQVVRPVVPAEARAARVVRPVVPVASQAEQPAVQLAVVEPLAVQRVQPVRRLADSLAQPPPTAFLPTMVAQRRSTVDLPSPSE